MGEKLWYGAYKYPYDPSNACFYNPADFKWATEIEQQWGKIKPEVQHLIEEQDRNFISNESLYKGVGSGKGWSSLSALFWGLRVSDSLAKKCPSLFGLLNKIPGLTSVSFSRLAPNTTIPEHHGETNAIMRCHFGIEVPTTLPECGLRAGSETQGWAEGKWLFFNDAQHHSAWNNTDKRRIVLIIDVIRPEFLYQKNLICAKILAAHFITANASKGGIMKNTSRTVKNMVFALALPFVYVMRPLYNILGLNKMYHE